MLVAGFTAFCAVASAAEERIWTSRKGVDIKAQLLRVEGDKAVLVTTEPREGRVDIEDLSLRTEMLARSNGCLGLAETLQALSLPEEAGTSHLEQLKENLETAVAEERYEDAAGIRDKIRELEHHTTQN